MRDLIPLCTLGAGVDAAGVRVGITPEAEERKNKSLPTKAMAAFPLLTDESP